MFQFTTTHVINNNSVFKALGKDGKEGTDLFQVKGVNNFKKDNVFEAYKATYTEPKNAKLTIDLSSVEGVVKTGDTLRLSLYIRLTSADNSSYYANDTQYKGRPFTIEFGWKENASATAENLEKIIKKYGLLVFEKEVVKTTVDGSTITLEAVNEFQRFQTYKLEKYIDSKEPFADNWEEITGAITLDEVGVEGFGTYGWVLRNLKLPTHEHTRAFAPKADEMPIPGANYNQYTIHYCVKRGPLGMNAVGDVVKSVTTHVFYVNNAVDSEFVSAAESVGINFTEVPTSVDDDGE